MSDERGQKLSERDLHSFNLTRRVYCRASAEVSGDDDSYADDDDDAPAVPKAFLMVRRKLSEEKPQVGKPFTVLVELHNAGEG
jgi:hypothetical protein